MAIVIDNFSMGIREWLPIIGLEYFAADVTDATYGIDLVNTYFIHNGVEVFTSYSGISGGYRCFYEPTSSGLVSSGVINITIHAQNTVSGVAEQTFHLLYGYQCAFNDIVDWGANEEVVFTIEATNTVICPNTTGEAFSFETEDLPHVGLGAFINPIQINSVDMNAVIYPQNTFFFYGRTYRIKIENVKDFAGNIMPTFEFNFTIENPSD